jgi:hypothetical protein
MTGTSALDLDQLVDRLSAADTLPQLPDVIDIATGVPPNPPEDVQTKFVGLAYRDAFNEARSFVKVADEWLTKQRGGGLESAGRVLDFGSGWGRISRMLLAHVQPTSLYAADVDSQMTALVNTTLPGINATTVNPLPPTMLGTGAFDAALAFSVFSHLAPQAHEAWAAEFGRVVAPGGMVFITVLDSVFIEQIRQAKVHVAEGIAESFEAGLATLFDDIDATAAEFAAGRPVYAPRDVDGVRTGDYYGWAAMPERYVTKVWGDAGFDIVQWVRSGVLFPQAMVGLVRRPNASSSNNDPQPVPPGRPGMGQLARRLKARISRRA